MKFLGTLLLLSLALRTTRSNAQHTTTATGGRDITVALFSSLPVTHITVTPLGDDAWTARCSTCFHQPLRAPLPLSSGVDLFAGGTLRVTDITSGAQRSTAGLWHFRSSAVDQLLDITVRIPSEHYVAAVLGAEAAPDEPAASLRALAIVARTFALNGPHYTAAPGHLPADICDSTACQAARFDLGNPALQNATRDTAGETLWFHGRPAEVFFSQHCGGTTEAAGALLPKLAGTPYLPSHPDPFCVRQGIAAWHAEIPLANLAAIASAQHWQVPSPLTAVSIAARTSSGRASQIAFMGLPGRNFELPAASFRLALGRTLGWNLIRSDLYQLTLRQNTLVFDGRGHGHGVGLCQVGAQQMARAGRSTRDILSFYFPGTTVRIRPSDTGWQTFRLGPLQVRSTQPLTTAEETAIANAWAAADHAFPTRALLDPTLVLAPSTELFRQLTHQPGWDLASTSAHTTVLQPAAVLLANKTALEPLLLHEFLHMRIEAEANDRAPLWIREGLAEVLAGEPDVPSSRAFSQQSATDRDLAFPGSREASRIAHKTAAARVRALLTRYGLSTVRGWLVSGVPSAIDCAGTSSPIR